MTAETVTATDLEQLERLYALQVAAVREQQALIYAAQAAGRWDIVRREADLQAITQGAASRVRTRIIAADPSYAFPVVPPEEFRQYEPPAHVENTTEAACWLMRLSDWWGTQPSEALLDWGSRLVRLRAACWRGWFGR